MATQKCAICGAEINMFQQQQLADKTYVCRKICAKRAMKGFDFVGGTLPELQTHIKQVEDGTRLYEKLFLPIKKRKVPGQKLKKFANDNIVVSEDLGLIARLEVRYKIFIFGKSTLASVYRIADLYGYEHESDTQIGMGSPGSKTTAPKKMHYAHFFFWDTPGVSDFRVEVSSAGGYDDIFKYFNKLFGIQKTLGNIGNTWKNQINAVKAAGSAVKAAVTKSDDLEEKAAEATQAIDRMQYGDRTEWIAKAEAALRDA